ncbi:DNA cytosine methyltransferase [Chitinophaga defluvii]|uniref:DNA (cytosine-5-)-methyltransferase n=1 Tax=Chitinophaga defluvii TaxID=3163343 RepID=A0ABV2T8M7_9BACT
MRHGSLFSGVGGFDLASKWMEWENVFQCEIDPFCRKVLACHFPKAKLFEDIKKMKGEQYYGTIDIISGGFPCQPFSLAGKRRGKNDDRYLWPEALRLITEIKPRWIVLENVAGLFSILEPETLSQVEVQAIELFSTGAHQERDTTILRVQRRVIGTIVSQISAAGYLFPQLIDGTPVVMCIPACSVGAPHRRDRVWIVAYANSIGSNVPQVTPINCQRIDGGQTWQETTGESSRCGSLAAGEIVTNSNSRFEQPTTQCERPVGEPQGNELRRGVGAVGESRAFTDSYFERLQRRMHPAESPIPGKFSIAHDSWDYRNAWQNFPVESPICRRNDGVSPHLVDTTFQKWRNNCIRAFGNAIVPQVAFQLFQAIQSVERRK